MTPQLDAPAVIASLIVAGLLLASACIWYRHSQNRDKQLYPESQLSAWPIGWINFGILLCALITAIFVAQQIVAFALGDSIQAADGEFTAELAIAGVAIIQIPLLFTFFGLRYFYPQHYSGQLNSQTMSTLAALKASSLLFIKYIPIIWISSLLWGTLLNVLQYLGLIDELPPQEIIGIFQAGGNFFAILLLSLSAVILAPIAEEIIFRGCIYRFLKSQTQRPAAQLISGAVFASIHGNLLSFVPLTVVGVLLARVYEESGNIKAPIIFHACFNGFTLCMLFLFSLSDIQI
jgi:membrane protease YdiL (CAAX protease family)